MASPILATPILYGKDAEKLIKEAEEVPVMTDAKKRDIARCLLLYEQFWAKLLKI